MTTGDPGGWGSGWDTDWMTTGDPGGRGSGWDTD